MSLEISSINSKMGFDPIDMFKKLGKYRKISIKEKLAYATKLLEESLNADFSESEYTQTGSNAVSSSSNSSTFSVSA